MSNPYNIVYVRDPIKFGKALWPDISFYDKQEEILYSVLDNDETFVPAGNMLGKDWIAGYAALWFFLCHPVCRVITTSVKDDHLRVVWGEINRFIDTSTLAQLPGKVGVLNYKNGGPLIVNHREIKKVKRDGTTCPISYLLGMVSEKGEGLAGHHAPSTLFIGDEASGILDIAYTQADTWAGGGTFDGGVNRKRKLFISNPLGSPNNFFQKAVKQGDLLAS